VLFGVGAAVTVVVLLIAIAVLVAVRNGDSEQTETADRPPASTTTTRPATSTTSTPPETLLAQVEAEKQRACSAATSSGKAPSVNYNSAWGAVGVTRAQLEADVNACVLALLQEQIATAGPVDIDGMIKNPDAFKGQVFTLVSLIVQFDAATGPCSFRGYWDNDVHEYNFEYAGDNGVFKAGDGVRTCPVLDGIDQDDVVRLWVRGDGAFTYSTQIGGSTTAPAFTVLQAEVIRKE
jgi:hypothetical protein